MLEKHRSDVYRFSRAYVLTRQTCTRGQDAHAPHISLSLSVRARAVLSAEAERGVDLVAERAGGGGAVGRRGDAAADWDDEARGAGRAPPRRHCRGQVAALRAHAGREDPGVVVGLARERERGRVSRAHHEPQRPRRRRALGAYFILVNVRQKMNSEYETPRDAPQAPPQSAATCASHKGSKTTGIPFKIESRTQGQDAFADGVRLHLRRRAVARRAQHERPLTCSHMDRF